MHTARKPSTMDDAQLEGNMTKAFAHVACGAAVIAIALASVSSATAAESKFLRAGQIDVATLLPSPPADGSNRQISELAELHRIQDARTAEALAHAKADAANETVTIFAGVLGPAFDISKLPATRTLFADVDQEEEIATTPAKAFFHRLRPYLADTTLKDCGHNPLSGGYTSYPSGHATVAYAMGVVLASLVPAKAQDILKRSQEFAEARLVCGVHYRSDIEGGQVLGTVLAVDLMQSPAFKQEYDAASAELRAAHMGGP